MTDLRDLDFRPGTLPSTVGWLDALFAQAPPDSLVGVSAVVPDATKPSGTRWASKAFPVAERDGAAGLIFQLSQHFDTYVRVTPLAHDPGPGRRGDSGNLAAVTCLWLDLDFAGPGHKPPPDGHPLPTRDEGEAILDVIGLPPTMVVDTGGGWHVYYLLDEALPPAEGAALVDRWSAHVGAVSDYLSRHIDNTAEVARLLRPPGSWRRKPGIEPNRVVLLDEFGVWPAEGLIDVRPWRPEPRYSAGDIEAVLRTPERPSTAVSAPSATRVASTRPRATSGASSGRYGPADAVAEAMSWADILEPHGWTLVGRERNGAELWLRPGDPSSAYSLKCWEHAATCWSSAAGLPVGKGQKLSKFRLLCHLNGISESEAARELLRAARRRKQGAAA